MGRVSAESKFRRHKNVEAESSDSPAAATRVDPSQTNFHFDLRLNGFSSLVNTVNKSTEKVKKMLTNDCDLILECRACRNLFRSIPNFVAHRESFCTVNCHPMLSSGFSQFIQDGHQNSFQLQHHLHNSLTEALQTAQTPKLGKAQRNFNHNQKSARLEQVLTRLGPTIQNHTRKPSQLYNDIITKTKEEVQNSERASFKKIDLLLEPLSGGRRSAGGIVFQTRVQSDPSICGVGSKDDYEGLKEVKASDTAVLDAEGKVMFVGAAGVVEDIVTRLVTQIEEKNSQDLKRLKKLNCHSCLTVFDTEKSLRTHRRTHCHRKKQKHQAIQMVAPPSSATESSLDSSKAGVSTDGGLLKRIESSLPSSSVGVIPFIPTSPIFSFKSGRATNNSFSASLNPVSPSKSYQQSPAKNPALTAISAVTLGNKIKPSSSSFPTATMNAKRPRLELGRRQNPAKPADHKLTCIKCNSAFATMTESEVSVHLTQCRGKLNQNNSHLHQRGYSTPRKSGIQVRHDYAKTPTSASSAAPTANVVNVKIEKNLPDPDPAAVLVPKSATIPSAIKLQAAAATLRRRQIGLGRLALPKNHDPQVFNNNEKEIRIPRPHGPEGDLQQEDVLRSAVVAVAAAELKGQLKINVETELTNPKFCDDDPGPRQIHDGHGHDDGVVPAAAVVDGNSFVIDDDDDHSKGGQVQVTKNESDLRVPLALPVRLPVPTSSEPESESESKQKGQTSNSVRVKVIRRALF